MSEHPPIAGYELVKLLGRNGHLAYLARQSSTGRLVHLKVVNSSGDFGRMVTDKLRHKAQVLAALDHPNIVRLVEVGEERGHGFFSALEYVEGDSLDEVARRQPLPPHAEVVRVLRAVAAALDYAHGRGVVHGNVHPSHILLDRAGHVFLTGFGEVWPELPEGAIFGNPHFLAPEQILGFSKTGPQTDVYELAEVAFLLLSGSMPFQGVEGVERLLKRKRSGPAPRIRKWRPDLPRRVDRTLRRATAVRPEKRFPCAGQFVEELEASLESRQREDKKWWQFWR